MDEKYFMDLRKMASYDPNPSLPIKARSLPEYKTLNLVFRPPEAEKFLKELAQKGCPIARSWCRYARIEFDELKPNL